MDKHIIKSTLNTYLNPVLSSNILHEIEHLKLDRYIKKLDIITFTKLLILAQINQIGSLTDISLGLNANKHLQTALGIESISTSQLSRKLRDISPEVFQKIFSMIAKQLFSLHNLGKHSDLRGVHLIDSSTITLCLSKYQWAEFRQTKAGVKVHLRLAFTDEISYPSQAILTTAKPADRTQMDQLVVTDPDAIHIFDRAYVDYRKFDAFCDSSAYFITRLKTNARIHEIIEEKETIPKSAILKETIVKLGCPSNYVTRHALRLIETTDSEGNLILILTNNLSLSSDEVSDLYRKRWQIELFFKWIKQHLVVKRFYGTSENAVFNQIYVALIAYCLLVILQIRINSEKSLLEIYKYLRLHWLNAFTQFLQSLSREPTRSSIGRQKHPPIENIWNETVSQFYWGEVDHLDCPVYDPLV